ncbi:RND family efflux transporter, MFP subunit [Sulfitobacter marinus]|uniref:RND family efflux transporter, MFP subunit n=1 Tax=Sulfitobacter marinus TaxID=394264 RepID=A0A1I6UPH1_9RHOB|nr:efflux RND transporter periplasmic adaptor subunit [Sulfitobacter marinus]SFT03329.1 RND family efflux transporter, MFP subunit [Sulfitobacter marinus]
MIKPVLTALICLLPLASHAQDAAVLTPSGDPAPMRAVKLITPSGSVQPDKRVFFGQIVAKETVDVSFEVGGRLVSFDAQEGEFLEAGTQIAALDRAPFERAVERARLQLEQSERDYVRLQKLAQSNTVAETQVEDSKTARDLAEVALEEAQDDLDDATLIVPFRALVASRLTPNFANVSPGQAIVRLHDMSEVRVEIDVPERLFQQRGHKDSLSFTGKSPLFPAEVPLELREFNAETQSIGQSYRVTFALPADMVSPSIIPGASMTVTATMATPDTPIAIVPPSAVTIDSGSTKVMVYTPDENAQTGTVDWQDVEVGSITGTDIALSGLAPDTQIVAAGAHLLRPGETVRPYAGLSAE